MILRGGREICISNQIFDSEDQGSAPSADVYDATGPVYYDQVSETNYGASSPYKIAETSLLTFTKKSTHWTLHLTPYRYSLLRIWIPLQMLKGQTPILIRQWYIQIQYHNESQLDMAINRRSVKLS